MARILIEQRRPAWAPKSFDNSITCQCGNYVGTVEGHRAHATEHAANAATRLGLNKVTRRTSRIA